MSRMDSAAAMWEVVMESDMGVLFGCGVLVCWYSNQRARGEYRATLVLAGTSRLR